MTKLASPASLPTSDCVRSRRVGRRDLRVCLSRRPGRSGRLPPVPRQDRAGAEGGMLLAATPPRRRSSGAGCGSTRARRLLQGGDSGPAVVPGKAGESLLIQAIRHQDGLAMPPKKPRLSEPTIADFESMGQRSARRTRPRADPGHPLGSPMQQARDHWAFRPVKKAIPPRVADAAWVKNPIDAFILAKLEARRWQPAPPAERGEWLRRVTFDVTGLPPSPEEIAAFENDRSPARRGAGRRPTAGQPAIRRAMGAALAGRGPLRRDRGLRV